MTQEPLKGALLAMVAFAAYACADVMLKALGRDMPSFQVVLVVGLFVLPFMLAQAVRSNGMSLSGLLRPALPGWTVLRTGIVSVNVVAVIYTFNHLPLAQCYAVFFTMPLLITLLAWPMLGERVDPLRGAIIVLGFVGVLVALQPGRAPLQLAHLIGLAGAALGALNSLILRRVGQEERDSVLLLYPVFGQLAIAAVLSVTYEWQSLPLRAWVAGIAFGIVATLGSVLIIAAYRIAPAIAVAPMQYGQILWASLLGYVLFAEVPERQALLGILLVAASGVALLWLAGRRPTKVAPVA